MMAHQDNLDHWCIDSDAQDHTSMTIEFLRARLLAERAVSKSARAKLDGLSDKVAELEEELKIVSLQRKKAEQATADVLAILEEHGFHDDAYDSSSDQESFSQTTNSVSAKSLSWKGRRREAASSDKTKESRNRRQRGSVSANFSSPRHHRQGRSCRQIKRSESRTVSEDLKRDGNTVVDLQGKGGSTEVLPITIEEASASVVDVTVMKGEESLQKLSCSSVLEEGNSIDIKLEKALRKRAQVVGSYEDMEETQKQWEKKFTENKSSALDVCDVGNHSDVTDEINGEKAQGSTLPSLCDTRSIANEVDLETLSHGSPDNSVTSPDKCCKSCGSKSVEEDASPPGNNGEHISESPESESSHPQSCKGISEQSSSTIRSPPVPRPNSRGGSFCSNATTIQYPLVPAAKETSDSCDSVLTALKQAKLALHEKVNSLHIRKPEYLSESSYPSTLAFGTRPSLPASNVGSMLEFPVGCAGLFRVPTDFSPDASTRNSFLASSSQKALVNYLPERDIPLLPGDQLFTKNLTSTKNLLDSGFQSQLLDTERPLTTPYIGGPKLWAGFREDGQPVVDTQESRLYKGTPRVSGSVRTSGFEGNQLSSTSFNLDRHVSTYTPLTVSPSRSLYPDSVLRSREMYSTPYYQRDVGLPPTGGVSDGLLRRG